MEIPAVPDARGLLIHVRLTPKSSVMRIAGVERYGDKPVLKAQVTGPPEDGKANAALTQMIARWLGVPKSSVTVASGQKSRLKSILVTGDGEALLGSLTTLLEGTPQAALHSKTLGKHDR